MALHTYVIEGGIGKCTAFTALIPDLVKKAKEPIQVYTSYIDCFANNPDVKMVYEQSLPLTDPRIMASDHIHYCEPYKSDFVFGQQHIIESYCQLFDVKYSKDMKPKLYTEQHKPVVDEWLKKNEITGDYMLVQFTGGQTPIGFNAQNQYLSSNPGRNYQPYLAQQVVYQLKEKYPDVTILDVSLPNEPYYDGAIKCDLHWAAVHELLKGAQGFITIDTCLNHFSASTGTKGVVIWGNTRWTQFGYSHNKNLHFHMGDVWNEAQFVDSDPRNAMVDPSAVVAAYEAKLKDKKQRSSILW